MAKPIILLTIPIDVIKSGLNPRADIIEKIKADTDNEYHVLILIDNVDKAKIECVNDSKGLTDVDIEKLIKEINV